MDLWKSFEEQRRLLLLLGKSIEDGRGGSSWSVRLGFISSSFSRQPFADHLASVEYGRRNSQVQSPHGVKASWPEGRALPFPQWASSSPDPIQFTDIIHYENFAGLVELISQQTVAANKYNTVDNFIRFYRAFRKSKIDSLDRFYREYEPPITRCHYTCVGLAFELIHQLRSYLSDKHDAYNKFYVVSCEEVIETLNSYVENVPPDRTNVEKEHILVCLRIEIRTRQKTRKGFLLLDPGYHISRVITVMEDALYPHTGKFMQCDDERMTKEYNYSLVSQNYIAWDVAETKGGMSTSHTNLIFAGSPFLNSIEVAERRNLMYYFKSLLQRDSKGRLLAGLYFSINSSISKVTIFYMENNNRTSVKLNLVNNVKETPEIRECERQLELKKGNLVTRLNTINRIMHDKCFTDQMLSLEERISSISAEN